MLTLDTFTFSSALPESFTIETEQDEDHVEVDIYLDGHTAYSTRLYANSAGVCTFYELRSIVEQYMIAQNLTLASFELMISHENGGEQLEDKYIIFSRHKHVNNDTLDFLESHFLTGRPSYVMPRKSYSSISFFATPEEYCTPFIDCVFERDGEIVNYRLNYSLYYHNVPYIYNISISPMSISNMVIAAAEDYGKLLAFTVHAGHRSMTVYVVEEEPTILFSFRNSYNAQESMPVFGTTTLKTEVSRKEAVSLNITSFYDKSVSRKWQVKTVPLSQEEAHWYNDFLESDCVTLNLSNDYPDLRILISDITSEISDSAKDLVHIKFSWRFEDNSIWLDEDRFPQVFSAPYNDTFK